MFSRLLVNFETITKLRQTRLLISVELNIVDAGFVRLLNLFPGISTAKDFSLCGSVCCALNNASFAHEIYHLHKYSREISMIVDRLNTNMFPPNLHSRVFI